MHHIDRIRYYITNFISSIGWKKFTLALGGGFLLGIFLFGLLLPSPRDEQQLQDENVAFVTIQTIGELARTSTSLSLIGEVESISGATIFTESAGIVSYVAYDLGDFVTSGTVLAEIENTSERAAVQSGRANLQKVEASFSRDISQVYTEALNAYRTAFTLASDAVFGKTDDFFSAPRTSDPRLNISQFGETNVEDMRDDINDILREWENNLSLITNANAVSLLETAHSDLAFIKLFLDKLSTIVSRQSPSGSRTQSEIDADKAALFSARSNTDTALSSVSQTLNNLRQTLPTNSGGTGEANAQIEAAQANLNSARAQLEKTIIRTPVSGTINSLSISAGDFVGSFVEIGSIANNNTLEITTFIGANDRFFVTVGSPVVIEDTFEGIVTKIAPALNPTTKKLEVKIGLVNETTELLNGSSVRLRVQSAAVTHEETANALFIPLEALKLTTAETVVFGISDENTLVAYPVMLGEIVGNSIEISGIDRDTRIVTDVRGLREGQRVEVRTKN